MSAKDNDVWVTGIGLVSCYGEGADHHWELLSGDTAPAPLIDHEKVAPYSVHPLPEMDWSLQIPRRGDQRQMENWQRLGTYAAGLALDDAGLKENADMCATMDLVVAAGGGERDIETDEAIIRDALQANDREQLILERLPNDLRPTLFLAQLSNLLAGNISIVHKVTGSSRTYMGEETAGVTAIENAMARIRSGQSTHILVGGSYNADRPDALLPHELNHYIYSGGDEGVIERQENGGGMRMGSVGSFLVLEEAEHAKKRGAKPYARLAGVASDLGTRETEQTEARFKRMAERLSENSKPPQAAISGATGVAPITNEELAFLANQYGDEFPVRAHCTLFGQPLEANFPTGVALAALALYKNGFYPPFEAAEKQAQSTPSSLLVTAIAHHIGEGMAIVEKID